MNRQQAQKYVRVMILFFTHTILIGCDKPKRLIDENSRLEEAYQNIVKKMEDLDKRITAIQNLTINSVEGIEVHNFQLQQRIKAIESEIAAAQTKRDELRITAAKLRAALDHYKTKYSE